MRKQFKRIMSLVLCIVMVFTSTITNFANDKTAGQAIAFADTVENANVDDSNESNVIDNVDDEFFGMDLVPVSSDIKVEDEKEIEYDSIEEIEEVENAGELEEDEEVEVAEEPEEDEEIEQVVVNDDSDVQNVEEENDSIEEGKEKYIEEEQEENVLEDLIDEEDEEPEEEVQQVVESNSDNQIIEDENDSTEETDEEYKEEEQEDEEELKKEEQIENIVEDVVDEKNDEPKEELETDDIEASPSEITDDYNEVVDGSIEETDEEIATPSEIIDEDVNEATPSDVINEEVLEEINEKEVTPSEIELIDKEASPSEILDEILESTPSEVQEINIASLSELLSDVEVVEEVATESEIVKFGDASNVPWHIEGSAGDWTLYLGTANGEISGNNYNSSILNNIRDIHGNRVQITRRDIQRVVIENNIYPSDCSRWFYGFHSLQSIDNIEYLDTRYVKNTSNMFNSCRELTSIDVSHFNTANVTNMAGMFCGLTKISSIDVSNFNTSKVTNMDNMFAALGSETSDNIVLDINNFNMSNVTSCDDMLPTRLNRIKLSKTAATKIKTMLYVGDWKNVSTNKTYKFDLTNGVVTIPTTAAGEYVKTADKYYRVYWYYENKILHLSGTPNTSTKYSSTRYFSEYDMLLDCFRFEPGYENCQINKIVVDGLLKPHTINQWFMDSNFYLDSACYNIKSIDLSKLDTSRVIDMLNLFYGLKNLTSIKFPTTFVTSKVKDLECMFAGCSSLPSLDLSAWTVNKNAYVGDMFGYYDPYRSSTDYEYYDYCYALKDIKISASLAKRIKETGLGGNWKDASTGTKYNFDNDEHCVTIPTTKAGSYTSLDTFTVTFNVNGGSAVTSVKPMKYTKISKPANPTKKGYTFSNWYKDANLTTPWNFSTDIVKKNTTLYAKWTPITYKVILKANGQTGSDKTITCKYGTAVTINNTDNHFTSKTHNLSSWNTKADGKGTKYAEGASIKNLSATAGAKVYLYAQWTKAKWTIKYNANGGTGTMKNQSIVVGTKTALTANAFKRTGYTFAGWAKQANATTAAYKNKASVNNLVAKNKTITLYAVWTENKYKVTYNLNSGSWAKDYKAPTTRKYTKALTLPVAANIKRTGYTFKGWYTDSKFKTKVASIAAKKGNMTVYAKWTINTYTVKFVLNDGAKIDDQKIKYNNLAKKPTAPKKTGYVINKWYKDSTYKTVFDFTKTKITKNTTLYAKWEKQKFKVTFVSNGGSSVAAQTIAYGNKIKEPKSTRSSYHLVGWYTDSSFKTKWNFTTKVTKQITLYAKWITKSQAETNAINDFKKKYITSGMTDFQKELKIVGWMVENIEYDYDNYLKGKIPQDSYDSYGALVLNKCVCDGYSKAFLKLASACGLTAIRVSGTANNGSGKWNGHAWNQIKLDNKWYNVDVTWEDPVYNNPADSPYNMDHLRCEYLNVTDAQLKRDHKWSGGNICTSDVYGVRTAFLYNKEGILKKSLKGDTYRSLIEKYDLDRDYDIYMNENLQLTDAEGNMKYDDGRNNIPDMSDASKAKIASYVKGRLEAGVKRVYVTTPKNSSVDFYDLFFDNEWVHENIGDYYFSLSIGGENNKYKHCAIEIYNW